MKTVVVAMSGGVDSSVAALLLKREGYRVIGMYMKNWEETDENGRCHSAKEQEDVIRVSEMLDIPYYTVNFTKEYQERVFSEFIKELEAGNTPNPDVLCNSEIKFNVLFDKAMNLGADYLATGHYCRTKVVDGTPRLYRGIDSTKDQSYFLHAINGEYLSKVLFPIGNLPKSEVRKIAQSENLPTAQKKESMGICFIGKRNFKQFISQYVGYNHGDIKTLDGKVVGRHDGVAYYTIGQRKGLKIGGEGEAWFVVKKDVKQNVIYVVQGTQNPSLYSNELEVEKFTWIANRPKAPFRSTAKIRYRQNDQPCRIESFEEDGRVKIVFNEPQRAITPSQSVVFYQGEECLGGGLIC